jgi:predicted kinase
MWKICNSYDWNTIYNSFSWVRDMAGVEQDPVFHQEGDVEIHTRMVLESLHCMTEYQRLTEQNQHILSASALLHDVEKRSATVKENDGRITSKGHAKKGEFTARNILYREIQTPFFIRESIAKLVKHHGLPLWIFEKENPAKSVIRASLEVNTELLYILAKADVLGRLCPDKEDLLYKLELFRELCMDYQCWGIPRHFQSAAGKFQYFQKEESSPDYIPFDDTRFEVFMLSAVPGSGKDTYIRNYLKEYPVVSLDDIRRKLKIDPTDSRGNGRVVQQAKEEAKTFMRTGKSFVWNATNTTKTMREQLIRLFTSYGGMVTIIYIEVPYKLLLKQNSERDYPVPENVLSRIIERLEVPSPAEAHEVKYVVGGA